MDGIAKPMLDRRLARIEGQIGGIRKMVREDKYCIDILTQVAAVRSALDQLGAEIVASHMKTCILGHGSGSEHPRCETMTPDELVDELRVAISRLVA